MKKTIIVLIALGVAILFYWQFFIPPQLVSQLQYAPEVGSEY